MSLPSQHDIDQVFIVRSREGNTALIKALLAEGKRPSNSQSLQEAASFDRFESALALLPFCDAKTANAQGVDPLRLALASPSRPYSLEFARALLASGADPSSIDHTGRDALGWALGGSREGALLVLPFCNPRLTLRKGYTLLMAFAYGALSEAVDLLLPLSDLEAVNQEGRRVYEMELQPAIRAQIEAFRQAQMERSSLEQALPHQAPRGPTRRV